MPDTCIIVMAKQPAPGAAKTRLAATIGTEAAARLAAAFLEDTVALVRGVPEHAMLLSYTPPSARGWFAQLADHTAILHEQPDGHFGVRLEAAFARAFASGADRAVVIATDSPSLPPAYIEDALDALRESPAVIGPAEDGGYYLLGLTRPLPHLFERIDWSTEVVFAQTRARARELGIRPAVLPRWYDVDGADDLRRLRDDLQKFPARCRRTREALNALFAPAALAAAAL